MFIHKWNKLMLGAALKIFLYFLFLLARSLTLARDLFFVIDLFFHLFSIELAFECVCIFGIVSFFRTSILVGSKHEMRSCAACFQQTVITASNYVSHFSWSAEWKTPNKYDNVNTTHAIENQNKVKKKLTTPTKHAQAHTYFILNHIFSFTLPHKHSNTQQQLVDFHARCVITGMDSPCVSFSIDSLFLSVWLHVNILWTQLEKHSEIKKPTKR